MSEVYDELGNKHHYDENEPLGEGGQGAVYRTADGDVAIKIEKGEANKESLKRFQNKIKSLIFKPLPYDLQISMPLNVLRDRNGYVMKLLDTFKPLKDLMPNLMEREKLNEWFFKQKELPCFLQGKNNTVKMISCYCASGALRFRLEILVKIAAILARLHLRGFAYCDLSHNNVFYNKDSVYFIDPDNIEYDEKITSKIVTPGYEFDDDRNSIYSDVYVFGILAFKLLNLSNPLVEKESGKESEDEWGCETTREYIENEKPLYAITPLKMLFRQCFNNDKFSRPTMLLWLKTLIKALNLAIKCPKCKMSYYDDLFDKCKFCDEKKPSRFWIKILQNEKLKYHLVREFGTFKMPRYFLEDFDFCNLDGEIGAIRCDSENIQIDFKVFVKNEKGRSTQNIIEDVKKVAQNPLIFYKDDLKIEIGCIL